MKIWTFSDLHMPNGAIDADRYLPTIPDADLCVVVGDLIEGDPGAEPDLSILIPEGRIPWSGHSGFHAAREV